MCCDHPRVGLGARRVRTPEGWLPVVDLEASPWSSGVLLWDPTHRCVLRVRVRRREGQHRPRRPQRSVLRKPSLQGRLDRPGRETVPASRSGRAGAYGSWFAIQMRARGRGQGTGRVHDVSEGEGARPRHERRRRGTSGS